MIVYKATNKLNNKIYIGRTCTSLKSRINRHLQASKKGSPYIFHKAIREVGLDNFEWNIIYRCKSIEEANEKERFYIKEYNSFGDGYNMNDGSKGYKPTEETILKIKEKLKNRKPWSHEL